jgi:predicted nucleic acid-binding protein
MTQKPLVYIETSIPNFYFEVRPEPEMVARRRWTRLWWDRFSSGYEVVTSEAVVDEIERGAFPQKEKALRFASTIPAIQIHQEMLATVETYVRHHVMPNDPSGDALHLAIASHHKCDFLLTWNCRHLANANKFLHIRQVNMMLGLFCPTMVTPLELLGGNEEVK